MPDRLSISQLMDLSGKTAIVTGGAQGIGRGIVDRLHEAGANIVVVDIDESVATSAVSELNIIRQDSALAVVADVSDSRAVDNLVNEAVKYFGGVDILVNNAGIYPFVPLAQMTEENFMKVINVNLCGVFLTTKKVSQQMIKQGRGGKIINITSIDALHPSAVGLAHYDASKHGVWGFTKNVALELAPHKIWVNAVAPGGVTTPGVAKAMGVAAGARTVENFKVPMGHMGEPDEIGRVVLFLASAMSSYMTGSQVVVDGGALLE